ncbi:hypothetical protein BDB00DRAFT_796029 [Zychaea mexicana]|uniref:uncharacterized protein n=1 Tax=Zychaea mexicana TaxID=64656 RepID=UPI0022FE1428|nr:uncharacterized protein BDB00DRAFT_796029 [Zychaea mexicana]KAI9499252.1 hypothetical protein BDB00DRAFT_796029 [Zychaea mexicana]
MHCHDIAMPTHDQHVGMATYFQRQQQQQHHLQDNTNMAYARAQLQKTSGISAGHHNRRSPQAPSKDRSMRHTRKDQATAEQNRTQSPAPFDMDAILRAQQEFILKRQLEEEHNGEKHPPKRSRKKQNNSNNNNNNHHPHPHHYDHDHQHHNQHQNHLHLHHIQSYNQQYHHQQ